MILSAWMIAGIPVSLAEPLSYQEALDEVLRANATLLGSEADRQSAEGALVASKGVWDPRLSTSTSQNRSIEQGRYNGIPFTTDNNTLGWNVGMNQSLSTGTSWGLQFDNSRSASTTTFLLEGVEFEDEVPAAYSARMSLNVSQQLLQGYKMAYNLQAITGAQVALSTAEANLKRQRQEVLSQAAQSYWDLYAAEKRVDASQRAVESAEEEERVVEAQVEAGNMAPIEITRVEASLAQTQLTLIEAQQQFMLASEALSLLLGREAVTELSVTAAPGEPVPLEQGGEEIADRAVKSNPGLQATRLSVQNAELQLDLSRHALLPTLSLSGSYGLSGYEAEDDPTYGKVLTEMTSGDFRNRYLGLQLEAPLGNRADRGAVQQAGGQLQSAKVSLEAQERDVRRQALSLVRDLSTAGERVKLARLQLELTQETLEADRARQEAGQVLQRDILASLNQVYQAELSWISAQVEWKKAWIRLQALQGQL